MQKVIEITEKKKKYKSRLKIRIATIDKTNWILTSSLVTSVWTALNFMWPFLDKKSRGTFVTKLATHNWIAQSALQISIIAQS